MTDVQSTNVTRGPAVVDVAAGAASLVVEVAVRSGRVVIRLGRPAVGVVLHPPLLRPDHQPISLVNRLAARGHAQMTRLIRIADERATAVVPAVAGAVFDRLDVTQLVVDRVDLNAILDQADMTGIIRQATEGVTSETVRSLRTQGIEADQAVARVVDRMLFRRRTRQPQVIDLVDRGAVPDGDSDLDRIIDPGVETTRD